MKSKLNQIKQQHKQDYESAVDTERTERYTDRDSTGRTSITHKTESHPELSPSPQCIKQVEIDEEGTWDEFSFGTNPETTERLRMDSIEAFNSGEVPKQRKQMCPIPKVPRLNQIKSYRSKEDQYIVENEYLGRDDQDNLQNKNFKKYQSETVQFTQGNNQHVNHSDRDRKSNFRQTAEFQKNSMKVEDLEPSKEQKSQLQMKKDMLKKKYQEHKNRKMMGSRQASAERENVCNENSRNLQNMGSTNKSDLSLSRSQSPNIPKRKTHQNETIDYLNTSTDRPNRLQAQQKFEQRTVFGEVMAPQNIDCGSSIHNSGSEEYEFNSQSSLKNNRMIDQNFHSFNQNQFQVEKENFNIHPNRIPSQINQYNTTQNTDKGDENVSYMSVQTSKTNKSRAKLRSLAKKSRQRSTSKSSLIASQYDTYSSYVTHDGGLGNAEKRELMVLSKKLGKLNKQRAESFSNLSGKYEKLLNEYTPYTEDEEHKLGEEMVSELGDLASVSIGKRNSKLSFIQIRC